MTYNPPRPRPKGKPRSIPRMLREENPNATEEGILKASREIHKRLREQSKVRTIS